MHANRSVEVFFHGVVWWGTVAFPRGDPLTEPRMYYGTPGAAGPNEQKMLFPVQAIQTKNYLFCFFVFFMATHHPFYFFVYNMGSCATSSYDIRRHGMRQADQICSTPRVSWLVLPTLILFLGKGETPGHSSRGTHDGKTIFLPTTSMNDVSP